MAFDQHYQDFTLDNGLKVALYRRPSATVSARLRVHMGALSEGEGEQGLAHLLEHALMMGGTSKYSPEQCDEVRGSLASYNAITKSAQTYFPVDIMPEDLEPYLDIVSDLVFHPRLDKTRIDEERKAILREISEIKSAPGCRDEEEYNIALLGNGPHTYFVGGDEDVIRHAGRADLAAFHARGYWANNMDLIAAGNLPENTEALIRKYFESRPAGKTTKFEFPPLCPLTQRAVLYRPAPEFLKPENPEDSSAQLYIGLVVPSDRSAENITLLAMAKILGGDLDSRLFKEVRQRRGLTYSIGTDYDGSNNKGTMQTGAYVSAPRHEDAIDAIFGEFARLRAEPVSDSELERIKKKSRHGVARMLDTNEGHVYAMETMLDTGITPDAELVQLGRLTPDMVMEAARKYLPGSRDAQNYVILVRNPLFEE